MFGLLYGNDRSELEKDIDVFNSRISMFESFVGIRFEENNVNVFLKINSIIVIFCWMLGIC